MRRAFAVSPKEENSKPREGPGPLTDVSSGRGEQEAIQNFFVGAIGSYKNSTGHRSGVIADPHDASEMIILASHLMRIVEARKDKTAREIEAA